MVNFTSKNPIVSIGLQDAPSQVTYTVGLKEIREVTSSGQLVDSFELKNVQFNPVLYHSFYCH